jgi:hypothetical protein
MGLREFDDAGMPDEWWDDFYSKHLDSMKQEYESGDGYALFRAIAFCGNEKIIMPEWVVQSLYDGMREFAHYRVKTLDEAFGITWPHKGVHLKTLEKLDRWSFRILDRVTAYSFRGWKIDVGTFEMVAEELGLKVSEVREIYYWHSEETRKKLLEANPRRIDESIPTPIPRI